MKSLRSAPALLALLALLCGVMPAWAANEAGPRRAPAGATAEDLSSARVIVKYRSRSGLMQAPAAAGGHRLPPQHAATLGLRLGLPLQDGRVLGERTQALRGQGVSSARLLARLRELVDVEWAVLDERRTISAVPNDPYYGPNQTSITPAVGQWYLRAPDSTAVSAINAAAAWDITTGSSGVTVAVLDTGVRFDHPDLNGKLYPGYDFVADATSSGDGGGRDADASDPGDYSTAGQCGGGSAASSSSWHGTQTAGLVGAASDNNIGMAGVGRSVMVLPVRVLGKCGGSDSDIIAAMRWAGGISSIPIVNPHPAKVISMSLGKSGACPASYVDTFTELAAAGVTVVIAAGNGTGTAVEAPANCNGALAVTGLRHVGTKVGFSSVGPQVAIAAPGGNCVNTSGPCLYPILTTTNAGSTTPSSNTYSDGTNYSVGTSFSAPLVAGTVALMLSVDPTLTPAAVRAALQASARPFPSTGAGSGVATCQPPSASDQLECYCTTGTCGAGMLNAAAAVAAVVPSSVAPPSAVVTASNGTPVAGDAVTLNATGSGAFGGRTLAGYRWQITSGATLATLSEPTNGSAVTLLTSGAGSVTVALTVTDSAGAVGSSSLTLEVQAASPPAGPAAVPSGGGGGATSGAWLLMLAGAAAALARSGRGRGGSPEPG